MRFKYALAGVVLLVCISGLTPAVQALGGGLGFEALNVTGDEFLRLKNGGTDSLNLADYWLGYVGSDDPEVIASPGEQLPALLLKPDEEILLSSVAESPCGAAYVGKLPFSSFTNSAGQLALWQFASGGFLPVNNLSWGSESSDDLNIKQETKDVANVWYRDGSALGGPMWLVGSVADCSFSPAVFSNTGETFPFLFPGDYPVFTIISPTTKTAPESLVAAADKGLAAPMINELLPNPATPQTDDTDEFIELYNPNDRVFDLSGFKLSVGSVSSSRTSSFTFPVNTTIKPGDFVAFKSIATGLNMPNTGGQVWLIDPSGKVIASSGVYGKAKDGFAFVRTGETWGWSALPTPGEANTLELSAEKTSTATSAVASPKITGSAIELTDQNESTGAVKGASTTASDVEPAVAVHPVVLASVAALALVYFLYEYRADLTNKFAQFKKYRAARRANRK